MSNKSIFVTVQIQVCEKFKPDSAALRTDSLMSSRQRKVMYHVCDIEKYQLIQLWEENIAVK